MQKKCKRKLTGVSFAFTHTHSQKTNTFTFFPQAYMENFEKMCKTQKKKTLHCPMLSVALSFPPPFFEPFPYVILDIPEVPADTAAGRAGISPENW